MRVLSCLWAVAAVVPVVLWAPVAGAQTAAPDIILVGGKIVTVEPPGRIAEALAIKGNGITAVGTTANIRKLAGPRTKVVDLGGRTVIPGLIDSHLHAIRDGLVYGVELDWSETASLQGALETVRAAARKTPPGTWISIVGGWHKDQFAEKRANPEGTR